MSKLTLKHYIPPSSPHPFLLLSRIKAKVREWAQTPDLAMGLYHIQLPGGTQEYLLLPEIFVAYWNFYRPLEGQHLILPLSRLGKQTYPLIVEALGSPYRDVPVVGLTLRKKPQAILVSYSAYDHWRSQKVSISVVTK